MAQKKVWDSNRREKEEEKRIVELEIIVDLLLKIAYHEIFICAHNGLIIMFDVIGNQFCAKKNIIHNFIAETLPTWMIL